ncbi:MAG: D-aminoacyl-tRNA deacylase [Eubacteriales bacterium]|nr:D-aminoacyl-tRNA deacylase [Eubacteriales bacterium]
MKFVIQKVDEASVSVDDKVVGKIGKGFLVLVGISEEDTTEIADKFVRKMVNLRLFEDSDGKTNLALKDVGGQVLLISQFTLYADCKKGNRPSFVKAGNPQKAEELYEYILAKTKESISIVEKGVFGAHMKVSLVNNGPFTIILDESIIH